MTDAAEAIRIETAEIERLTEKIRAATDELAAREIERIAAAYVRDRDLPALLPNHWKNSTRRGIIIALKRALDGERKALAAQRWHGDRNRMIALAGALRAEERGNI